MSSYNVYEKKNGYIVVATITKMNPTSKQISVKYRWFSQKVGEEFVIRKLESANQKAYIFTKGLQGEFFVSIRKFLCSF